MVKALVAAGAHLNAQANVGNAQANVGNAQANVGNGDEASIIFSEVWLTGLQ